MSGNESAPAVVPTAGYAAPAYPRAGGRALRWLIIGGVLFLLADAVAIGYVVLNRDTLFPSGEDYGSTNRSLSMGMMVYR